MPKYYEFDVELEDETPAQKRIKKISKIVIAVMLILMLSSFVVPYDVLISMIESDVLKDNSLRLKDKTVMFKPEVLDNLTLYYIENQMTEWKVCLTGYVAGTDYRITGFYSPKTYFATPISVSTQKCSQETIITLHTHPFRNCLFSYQDIATYHNYKRINPKALTGVMCDIDRFAFYEN